MAEFGKYYLVRPFLNPDAISSPHAGSVTGSKSPEIIKSGTSDVTGLKNSRDTLPRTQFLQARFCWNTR